MPTEMINTPSLFLGFPCFELPHMDFSLEGEKDSSLYLIPLTINDRSYLGKEVGPITDLPSLTLLEKNILTLHQRLFPSATATPSLVLLTLKGQ